MSDGWNGYAKRRSILSGAAGIDKLYRRRDPSYMRMVDEFVSRFADFDLLIFIVNFIHPDIISTALRKPTKLLAFVDDPYTTYQRGIPFLWAFDGAFYISPSYNERWLFPEALERWGCSVHRWWPLTQPFDLPDRDSSFFENRDVDLVYIGNPHPNKLGRLAILKKHFGDRFRVHGRWALAGFAGWSGLISGKPVYWRRVRPISQSERTRLYYRSKIGFNMHVSDAPCETGNMRMYELPAHGVMQICDRAGRDAHSSIFAEGHEAIYYDDLGEAVEQIEYYLAKPGERMEIARAGYERVQASYRYEDNFRDLVRWGLSIERDETRRAFM